jgi:hypothetical protein
MPIEQGRTLQVDTKAYERKAVPILKKISIYDAGLYQRITQKQPIEEQKHELKQVLTNNELLKNGVKNGFDPRIYSLITEPKQFTEKQEDEVQFYIKDNIDFKKNVNQKEKQSYTLIREIGNIRSKNLKGIEASLGSNDIQKAGAVLAPYDSVHVISDYDNTVSKMVKRNIDGYPLTEFLRDDNETYVHRLVPGGSIAEPVFDKAIKENPKNFHKFFSRVYEKIKLPAMIEEPELHIEGGTLTPLREGVPDGFETIINNGENRISIISASAYLSVKGGIQQTGFADQIAIHALSEKERYNTFTPERDINALEKGAMIKKIIIDDLQKGLKNVAYVYIGDGGSDIPALEANKQIAFYFALEGSGFAKELEELKKKDPSVIYLTYKTWIDIKNQWTHMQEAKRDFLASKQSSLRLPAS